MKEIWVRGGFEEFLYSEMLFNRKVAKLNSKFLANKVKEILKIFINAHIQYICLGKIKLSH